MYRNLILLLLLAGTAAAVYFLVFKRNTGTLSLDETSFAVEDTASIGKIFIADMEGKSVVLERSSEGWTVNNRYPVRRDYIVTLLSTIKRIAVTQPVPDAAMNTVVRNLAGNNKKVELFDRSGKKIRSYFVGGPSLDQLGTYMMMDGAEKPYIVAIPGFVGVVNTRYETDENLLRSLRIYSYKPHELSLVGITWHEAPDDGFTIHILGADSFLLLDHEGKQARPESINKESIHQYLELFRFVNCETYSNDVIRKDSVLQTAPFITLHVTDRAGTSSPTVIYHMPRTQESTMQYDEQGNLVRYDVDRYFATINQGRDFVVLQQFHFGKLFRTYQDFISP